MVYSLGFFLYIFVFMECFLSKLVFLNFFLFYGCLKRFGYFSWINMELKSYGLDGVWSDLFLYV